MEFLMLGAESEAAVRCSAWLGVIVLVTILTIIGIRICVSGIKSTWEDSRYTKPESRTQRWLRKLTKDL